MSEKTHGGDTNGGEPGGDTTELDTRDLGTGGAEPTGADAAAVEEDEVLSRAEEVLHVQDQSAVDTAGIQPATTEIAALRDSPWASARVAKILFGVAALGLVLIVVAFFWDAFEDAAKKGEKVVRSSGIFLRQVELLVDSKPDGARVVVDGQPRGRTPALMTVECEMGRDLIVKLRKPGYVAAEHKVECNERPLKLKVTLERVTPQGE